MPLLFRATIEVQLFATPNKVGHGRGVFDPTFHQARHFIVASKIADGHSTFGRNGFEQRELYQLYRSNRRPKAGLGAQASKAVGLRRLPRNKGSSWPSEDIGVVVPLLDESLPKPGIGAKANTLEGEQAAAHWAF